MNRFKLLILVIPSFIMFSCQPKIIGEINLSNFSGFELIDGQVVISYDSIISLFGEIPKGKTILLTDSAGKQIPCQLDDINGDGQPDELVFVYNFSAGQSTNIKMGIINKSKAPKFSARTQANFGKKVGDSPVQYLTREVLDKAPLPRGVGYPYKTDGPTWESDKAGYRHYFDGRNCRDFFCKVIPDMVLDTVGIWPDGTIGDTYHTLKSWGRDVLGVGQSFGLGGLAVLNGDSLVRMGVLRSDSVDNSDSTVFTLISSGPVRSIFKLDNYGWIVGDSKINVHQVVSIWAGRYMYGNEVKFEGDSTSKFLITGLVHNNDSNGLTVKEYAPGYIGMLTHDHQTYNRQFYMGLALLIPSGSFIENFDTPDQGSGILYTYCAKLKAPFQKPLKYFAMAACELQDIKFQKSEEFIKVLDSEATVINNPVTVRLMKIGN